MLDQNQIARLESTPIEDVAERLGLHVAHHKCLCPFHDDRHPSLTFNTLTNRYRCFVCDAHGGVIDLVMRYRHCSFLDACRWLGSPLTLHPSPLTSHPSPLTPHPSPLTTPSSPDIEYLRTLIRRPILHEEAWQFFCSRAIRSEVVQACQLTSIIQPTPCWRYGKPFYDAPSILIPYFDVRGNLLSVQSRYLGQGEKPRFKFPRGSRCPIYNLPILAQLREGEELWITEGCSDCWAMLSSGRKAIAIPSATLLHQKDLEPLYALQASRSTTFHMCPDQDLPGEKLFMDLFALLPQLVRHQLPQGCKDFGDYWKGVSCPSKIST